MRISGAVTAPPLDPQSHVCWLFDGADSFRYAAVEFLRDGARRGERLLYVADRDDAALTADLAELGDVRGRVAVGSLVIHPIRDLYQPDDVFDRHDQVARYEQLTARALADGYTGLRVAADATSLARIHAGTDVYLAYELAVDAVMARRPMSALCAYHAGGVGETGTRLAALHPQRHARDAMDPAFSLFYGGNNVLRVAGEVDLANESLFERSLDLAASVTTPDDVMLDLAGLSFIDVGGIRAIGRFADRLADEGRLLRLVRARAIVRECCRLLGNRRLAAALGEGVAQ